MKFTHKLKARAEELVHDLTKAGVPAVLGAFHEYHVKVKIGTKGSACVFYSPKKDSYKVTVNELHDAEARTKVLAVWDNPQTAFLSAPPAKTAGPTESGSGKASLKHSGFKGHHIFVDGSHKNGRIRWAFIVVHDNKKIHENHGDLEDGDHSSMRNVAGEIRAVTESLEWCRKHKIKEVTLHYDYSGLEMWALGEWKTNNESTRAYSEFFNGLDIKVSWNKIKSHSGNHFNEMVDRLAGKGHDV